MIRAAIAILLLTAGAVAADTNANASSVSSSGIYMEGTEMRDNTPSVGGNANSTAPCVVGNSVGLGIPGLGFNIGTGHVNKNCATLQEAQAIRALLGDRAAIAHLCKHNKRMQATLVELGVCVVKKR